MSECHDQDEKDVVVGLVDDAIATCADAPFALTADQLLRTAGPGLNRRLDPALRRHIVRRSGVAVNLGRSEEGLVAIGRALMLDGEPVAAVSIAMPASRYFAQRLPEYDASVRRAVAAVEAALGAS
ncbi:MAG TPA: IclR family transcriptional regulator C-terminal domain-containing protein [Nocardioides sp.]|uniref:IclR family transcriptional regulator domain-containing protein n=1 Tax=Nocardioides sp. TaxID=35761 RepID=UPI002B57EA1F|nr:IclR family transcriptional regulator C-terminal domain-containing protein [Nocardioides sp.]HQR25531.1 IclR family transcriptional regulator C-terminal domain-containing protein [Nocardioides sp.]